MKKILITLVCIFMLCGCDDMNNTPKKQVETFFNNYQTLDKDVLDDLNRVISEEEKFDTADRDEYREIIKQQYKNLVYEIKDEFIEGDDARVTVEITVLDYNKVLNEAEIYKNQNMQEFKNEAGNYDSKMYTKYILEKLKSAKDKVKYTLELGLTKIDDKWQLIGIDEVTEDKILGIYEY